MFKQESARAKEVVLIDLLALTVLK